MGVHKVSAFYPFIFQKSGKSTIIRNLAVPRHFVAYLVFISSIRVDPGPRNRGPTSLLALKIRTPVANTGKLSSIDQVLVIRAAQSSVFCVVFCRPLFIILFFFAWPLHCLPFFDLWLPTILLASTNFSYLLTYTRTILSQLSNLFHCNIYVKIYWRLQLFGIMNFLMLKD